jgi:hypothetical protein
LDGDLCPDLIQHFVESVVVGVLVHFQTDPVRQTVTHSYSMSDPAKMKLRSELDEKAFKAWRGRLAKQRECNELWKKDKVDEAQMCQRMVRLLRKAEDSAYDDLIALEKEIGYRR